VTRSRRRVDPAGAGLAVWAVCVFAFLFAPIVTAVLYSFNRGVLGKQTATFTGFTTHWYPDAWNNPDLRHAVSVSFRVALATAVIAAIIGTMAGMTLARYRGKFLTLSLESMVYLLLIVPEIVLGVSLLLYYSKLGVSLGYWPLVAGHSPFTIAVVALIVRSRALALDRAAEESAADLGAGALRTFWDVVRPQIQPAVLAGVLLAFTFSFDDLVISVFLTTPTVNTLPVYLFGSVRFGVTPDVYAIATMMLGFTLVVLGVGGVLYWLYARRTTGQASPTVLGVPVGEARA
jgi:ABC-type spermidine/putrescine transport system permease subunit II